MKYTNLLLFAIPSTLTTGHFIEYFTQNSKNLYLFLMPLTNQSPEVILTHYQNSRRVSQVSFFWYKGNDRIIRYLFFYLYYLWTVFIILPKQTVILATTPQYCFLGSLFYLFKKIQIVYHVGDYYPGQSRAMNLYQKLIHYYNDRLKYVIYCSPLLETLLRNGKPKKDGNRSGWVFGIKKRPFQRRPVPNLMGYIGMLRPKQGVDIIFDALLKNKKLKLEIIGDGPLLKDLKEASRRLKLTRRVRFLGLVQDDNHIQKIVSRWEIGLAPYYPGKDNMTYYTEPSKIKFYLEFNLPVIMTKITYMSKELEKYGAGVCIDYDSSSLLEGIRKIQTNYKSYESGVSSLVNKYQYEKLYDREFKFFTTLWQKDF